MRIFHILVLLSALLAFGSSDALAQKAKFKTLRAKCQKGRLPTHYVEPDARTYTVFAQGTYAANVEVPSRSLYGWTRVNESPNLEAVVSLYGFRINPAKRQKVKQQKTDKEGNVTDTWWEYYYTGSAEGKGTLYVYGDSEEFVFERKLSKAAQKREEEARAKKEAKQEELADNPFLTSDDAADAEDAGESDISEDTGLESTEMPLKIKLPLDISTSVATRRNRSATNAYKEYRDVQLRTLYDFRDNYPTAVYNNAMSTLNKNYGYAPANFVVFLKPMKSDKHPEYETWNNACEAAETLFKMFRYNKSIEEMQVKFDPIITYFNQQVESISEGDRKNKNLRKAAFNNLLQIMFYLDRHEEVMTLCAKHMDAKFLDSIAEKMSENSRRQQALLTFHKLDSRHFADMADIEDGEVEDDDEDEDSDEDDDDADGR